ncbi:phosphoribosyl-ATP diphosphatase [Candidatus Leptofilum sp.]|uniref:phosphoribosyl-ATP diphosphatase n=1 Tax=Candidatus Leptofilum sp. TaxID=3241576 RepID=UPI003B58E7F2
MSDFIDQLFTTLQDRKANPVPGSYTASLLADGEDEIVKKIGEEAVEVILAAKGQGNQRIIEETADLVYHLLVLLVSHDLTWDDIRQELASRHK